jgi:non-haem dioxygenase in morphine synthesis N-terminal
MAFHEIPVVSLAEWTSPGADRAAFADHLRSISHEVGFFQLVDHGVSPHFIDDYFDALRGPDLRTVLDPLPLDHRFVDAPSVRSQRVRRLPNASRIDGVESSPRSTRRRRRAARSTTSLTASVTPAATRPSHHATAIHPTTPTTTITTSHTMFRLFTGHHPSHECVRSERPRRGPRRSPGWMLGATDAATGADGTAMP